MSNSLSSRMPADDVPRDRHGYRTTPVVTDGMPPGVPYIIGNEAAERFSYYGMKAILYVFMTEHILAGHGMDGLLTPMQATFWIAAFGFGVYFLPLIGALVADGLLGKYRTIISLSVVYCLGHLTLALDETRLGLTIGLVLIAVGSGGIKPCVSSNVGDQFGARNAHLISRVYSWFYFSINFGAAASTLLTPVLLDKYGPRVAFGVPGIFMLIATIVFWLGRKEYVHVPPRGLAFLREAFQPGESRDALLRIAKIYLFVAVFWCLFEQTASVWVEQAKHMDREFDIAWLHSLAPRPIPATVELDPSQNQATNPILIMILIPLFTFVIYPAMSKFMELKPLPKVSIGFFLTAAAFAMSALIEMGLERKLDLHISWQMLAYVVLTAAEVMVSITCLEFAYTQAPPSMKSFVMSINLLSVAVGHSITMFVSWVIQDEQGKSRISGSTYYWIFTILMFVTACAFVFVARGYRGRTYTQDEAR